MKSLDASPPPRFVFANVQPGSFCLHRQRFPRPVWRLPRFSNRAVALAVTLILGLAVLGSWQLRKTSAAGSVEPIGTVAAAALSAHPSPVAMTFTVTVANHENNGCDASCSLREAILAANANVDVANPDTINFNIPGGGLKTINLTSGLPQITDPVIIDGYTQPGSSPNT